MLLVWSASCLQCQNLSVYPCGKYRILDTIPLQKAIKRYFSSKRRYSSVKALTVQQNSKNCGDSTSSSLADRSSRRYLLRNTLLFIKSEEGYLCMPLTGTCGRDKQFSDPLPVVSAVIILVYDYEFFPVEKMRFLKRECIIARMQIQRAHK